MSSCTLSKSTYRGWDSIEMRNEFIRLVAVPQIGSRIMAYDLGSLQFIYVDPDLAGKLFSAEENKGDGSLAAWKNYGGDKTWPSPQGWETDAQWHGPPDPVLDTGIYQADYGGDERSAWIEMTSPQDERTGVQITRKFTIHSGSTHVDVHLSFRNISQKKIKWSIWDVIQLDASRRNSDGSLAYDPGCSVTTRLNTSSRFENGFYVMFGDKNNPQWRVDRGRGLIEAKYLWEIGKIGIDTDCGWAAFNHQNKGCAFTELFTHYPEEEYPDQGVGVECWTVGRGKVANLDYEQTSIFLMEVEVLSPFYVFLPGETKKFEITWGVCKVDGPVVDVKPGGCTISRLGTRQAGDKCILTGAFGVYHSGELYLQWLDAHGNVVSLSRLQAVAPDKPVSLSAEIDLPPAAVLGRLVVKPQADERYLLLSESPL